MIPPAPPPATAPAAVIFDLGGVLFRYHPQRRLDAFARLTGESPDTIHKQLVGSGYSRSCDAGRLKGDAAYREGLRLLGLRMTQQRFRELWNCALEPDPEVVALARALKPAVPLALLTNNSGLVRDGLEQRYSEVLDLFRPRLFSCDLGLMKPDPRIFTTLLDLLGQPPERVLFIDDAPNHVAAAAAMGLRAYPFSGAGPLRELLAHQGLLSSGGGSQATGDS